MPLYSVIVVTFNRAKLLPLALLSITSQTVSSDEYEILVIDDSSTDNTKEVVAEFAEKHQQWNIAYHCIPHGGEARARNEGVRRAHGSYIFFTDDDCVVPPNWIAHYRSIYQRRPEAAGVGGSQRTPPLMLAKSGVASYIDMRHFRFNTFDQIDNYSSNFFYNPGVGNAANMSYKKEVLELVGGFDEKQGFFCGSVDFEMKKRLMNRGFKLYFTPLDVFHLKEYKTIGDIYRYGKFRGRGLRFFWEKNADLQNSNFGPPAGKALWRTIKQDMKSMPEGIPFTFLLYVLIEQFGRWRGFYHLKKHGPHSDTWELAQSLRNNTNRDGAAA